MSSGDSDTTALVRPSRDNPWDVSVVSCAPKKVLKEVLATESSTTVVGARSDNDGYVAVYGRDQIRIWSTTTTATPSHPSNTTTTTTSTTGATSTSSSSTHRGPFLPPMTVHACFHPSLLLQQQPPTAAAASPSSSAPRPSILLALGSSSTSTTKSSKRGAHSSFTSPSRHTPHFLHVLTAHPTTGLVLFWKLNVTAPPSLLPKTMDSKLVLHLRQGEHLTCLTSHNHNTFVLGTSHNRIFWCYHTPLPCMLYASELERKSSSNGGSWMGRFLSFGTTSGSEQLQVEDAVCGVHALSITMTTVVSTNNSKNNDKVVFVSITKSGLVEVWQGTTASSPGSSSDNASSNFVETHLVTLGDVVLDQQQQEEKGGMSGDASGRHRSSVQVLQSAVDETTLHAIVCYKKTRIYWIIGTVDTTTTTPSFTLTSATWLNRFHPDVSCVGLVCTKPHTTYAMFQYENGIGPITCVSMDSTATSYGMHEVDLPVTHVPRFVPGTLGRDVVTHGCWGLAQTGLCIRSRCHGAECDERSVASFSEADDAVIVQTLTRHLQSAFWHYYQHGEGGELRLPPSLQMAEAGPLERAVLATAKQLQVHPHHANPLECHLAFITLLQEGGVYRSLSSSRARWTLLGIGQELAVHRAMLRQTDAALPTDAVAQILREWHSPNDATSLEGLCIALQAADAFRQDYAQNKYDIVDPTTGPPLGLRLLLTTQGALQQLLRQVLWDEADALVEEQTKLIVTLALHSHRESRGESPSSEASYKDVKQVGISLIRQIPNDDLAFQLAVDHSWFEGLCQMALDHRKDVGFELEPLFATFQHDTSFASFVLDWFTEKGLYADVLNYGRLAPEVLKKKCDTDRRLIRCRWIASVRSGEYDQAGDWLVDAAMDAASLADTKRALSLAKVTLPRKRCKTVSAKLELVRAQEMLVQDESESPLQTPENLLLLAIDKIDAARTDKEDAIRYAMIGLAIAKTMEDEEVRIQAAARVWSKCVSIEMLQWMQWIQGEDNYRDQDLKDIILERTLFGGLWNEVRMHPVEVSYSGRIEYEVFQFLGLNPMENFELKRLLSCVTEADPQL